MRHLLFSLMALIMPCSLLSQTNDSLKFVYLSDGSVRVYPDSLIQKVDTVDEALCITLLSDSVVIFEPFEVDSISLIAPRMANFTNFKFNDKYNDGLPEDVFCTIEGKRITGVAGGLGKYLAPSFRTDDTTFVYVNGVSQKTKVSRVNFANDVTYLLSNGKCTILTCTADTLKDDDNGGGSKPVDSDSIVEIPLVGSMLSTNAPSGRGEGVENMVDNDMNTYFHSTWSGDPYYEKLPLDSCTYIDVKLEKSISSLLMTYTLREANRTPYIWQIYGSDDFEKWTPLAQFSVNDSTLNTEDYLEYTSASVLFEKEWSFLRLEMREGSYKNYIVIRELKLYEVFPKDEEKEDTVEVPVVPKDTIDYIYSMQPYGNEYNVHIDWKSDTCTVPRIDIDIVNGAKVTSKEVYLRALLTLDGGGLFDDFCDSVNVKGRGNSTWSGNKRPYRLKFDEKVKLCGMKSGKSWVLLANAQDVTLMENAVGFKAGQLMKAAFTNHSIPVDLYMNGSYYGSYTLTEKLGINNNSVDLDDLTPFFELDTYYDEPYKFRSAVYGMPVMLHNPDFTDETEIWPEGTMVMFKKIQRDYNSMEHAVDTGNYKSVINVDSLARFMLVNDLVLNLELMHPKSTYLYKSLDNGQYYFGPIWDLDWGFGYELNGSYFKTYEYPVIYPIFGSTSSYRFFDRLFTQEDVKKTYYRLWRDFIENHLQELLDYIDVYAKYAHDSFEMNSYYYGSRSYAAQIEEMKTWLVNRADYVYSSLTVYPDDSLVVEVPDTSIIDKPDTVIIDKPDTIVIEKPDTIEVDVANLPISYEAKVSVQNGALVIDAESDMMLPVYTLDGKQIALIQVNKGHNLYLMLPKGTFVVNRQKFRLR